VGAAAKLLFWVGTNSFVIHVAENRNSTSSSSELPLSQILAEMQAYEADIIEERVQKAAFKAAKKYTCHSLTLVSVSVPSPCPHKQSCP
jgi:hypothetical protein